MKKFTKTLAVLALALVSIFALTACNQADPIVNNWKVQTVDGVKVSQLSVQERAIYQAMSLEITKDGEKCEWTMTLDMTAMSDSYPASAHYGLYLVISGDWSVKDGKYTVNFYVPNAEDPTKEDKVAVAATVKDGILSLDASEVDLPGLGEGGKMTFEAPKK